MVTKKTSWKLSNNKSFGDLFPDCYNRYPQWFNPIRRIRSLRLCETPSTSPYPGSVAIKNCKQIFLQMLACTIWNEIISPADIISAGDDVFLSVNVTTREKSCLQCWTRLAVFQMLVTTEILLKVSKIQKVLEKNVLLMSLRGFNPKNIRFTC